MLPRPSPRLPIACLLAALAVHALPAFPPMILGLEADVAATTDTLSVVHSAAEATTLWTTGSFRSTAEQLGVVIALPGEARVMSVEGAEPKAVERLDIVTGLRLIERAGSRTRRRSAGVMGAVDGEDTSKIYAFVGRREYALSAYSYRVLPATSAPAEQLEELGFKVPAGAADALAAAVGAGNTLILVETVLPSSQRDRAVWLTPIAVRYTGGRREIPLQLAAAGAAPGEFALTSLVLLASDGFASAVGVPFAELPSDFSIADYVLRDMEAFRGSFLSKLAREKGVHAVFQEFRGEAVLLDEDFESDVLDGGKVWKSLGLEASEVSALMVTRLALPDARGMKQNLTVNFAEGGDDFIAQFDLESWWGVKSDDPAALKYRATYREKQVLSAQNLSNLTGWVMEDVMEERLPGEVRPGDEVRAQRAAAETEARLHNAAVDAQQEARQGTIRLAAIAVGGAVLCGLWFMVVAIRARGAGRKGGPKPPAAGDGAKKSPNSTQEFRYPEL